jgi:hypothetical protein
MFLQEEVADEIKEKQKENTEILKSMDLSQYVVELNYLRV